MLWSTWCWLTGPHFPHRPSLSVGMEATLCSELAPTTSILCIIESDTRASFSKSSVWKWRSSPWSWNGWPSELHQLLQCMRNVSLCATVVHRNPDTLLKYSKDPQNIVWKPFSPTASSYRRSRSCFLKQTLLGIKNGSSGGLAFWQSVCKQMRSVKLRKGNVTNDVLTEGQNSQWNGCKTDH